MFITNSIKGMLVDNVLMFCGNKDNVMRWGLEDLTETGCSSDLSTMIFLFISWHTRHLLTPKRENKTGRLVQKHYTTYQPPNICHHSLPIEPLSNSVQMSW